MKCPNCGNISDNPENKFFTSCGTKLDNIEQRMIQENSQQNNQTKQTGAVENTNVNYNISNNTKNDTTTFLVIGIIMSLCCSVPFGVGVILLNELKYKKELQNNQIDDAKTTKIIMNVLIVVGILLGILATGLQFISTFIEGLIKGMQGA